MDLSAYRDELPITETYVFLNHAAVAPVSLRVSRVVSSLVDEMCRCGIDCYPGWMEGVEAVRHQAARLLGAGAHEIAFVTNTSDGLSVVAGGLDWRVGDRVMVVRPDFPSNIYPWIDLERKGVAVDWVSRREGRIQVEDLEKALRPGTRLLTVSSVDFLSGYRADLAAMGTFCRQKGLLFCVDGIQSLGLVPVDVKGCHIDFLSAGGHKWLLGPMGCGVLYVAQDVMDLVHPRGVGWKSVRREHDFFTIQLDFKPDALRFEPGSLNLLGIHGLGGALNLLLEVGVERIFEGVLAVNDLFIQGLRRRGLKIVTPLERPSRSGILSFIPKADPEKTFYALMEERIMVSERKGLIRLSPHFYNSEADVRRFFEALDRMG
jgi:cysteine desulfurase / selenocysteine lyase